VSPQTRPPVDPTDPPATADPEISRYEEDEDIDAAKIPETTRPHTKEGKMSSERTMKMFSALACVKN